jgi:peptidoglycan hydrolase CwlO-like protein
MTTKDEKNKNNDFFKPIIIIPLIIQLVVYTTIISASHFTLKARVDKNEIQLRDNNLYQLNTKLDEVNKNLTNLTNTVNAFLSEYWKNRVEDAKKYNE